MNNIEQLIRNHLKKMHVMQLATVRDGQPWACNVHFAADADLNLYWVSTPDRRHSQEIADDPRVAVAMQVSDSPAIGLQLEGDAKLVEDRAELEKALEVYAGRHERQAEWVQEMLSGQNAHKMYVVKPRLWVLFDKQAFPDDTRQEWLP